MMHLLAASAVTIGDSVPASLIAKATVVVALALATARRAHRRPAAVHHLIFAAAFAVLGLLPVATTIAPAIPIRLPSPPALTIALPSVSLSPTADAAVPVGSSSAPDPTDHTSFLLSGLTLLPIVWVVGTVSFMVPVGLGLWQIRHVRRQSSPWNQGQTIADVLAHRVGLHRRVDVVVSEGVFGPITYGVVRPAIVFPVDARAWGDADIRRALVHELEHVRRRDWLTLCLARVISAAYWFHPLVWIANRRLRINAERACDDAVLRESHAVAYAGQLLMLAERCSAYPRRSLLAMATPSELSTRVRAVLDAQQQRAPASMRLRTLVSIAAVTSLVLLAPTWTSASGRQQTPNDDDAKSVAKPLRFDAASIKPSFGSSMMNVRPLPGGLTADATPRVLMQYAYGVQPFQLVGGPAWVTSARYAIVANAGAPVNRAGVFRMLQSLLEDRFQLKAHKETRESPAFALVTNRGGVKLSTPREGACVDSATDAAPEWAGGRMAVPGEVASAKGRCGSAMIAIDPRTALMQISGGRIAMSEFTRVLSMVLGRVVLDNTGYQSLFDVQLNFVPDDSTPSLPPPPPDSGLGGPSIARALQQQLGLRLESTTAPVEMIVIDSAARPSEN